MARQFAVIRLVRWEDPPPPMHPGHEWTLGTYTALADELRSRPGRWAVIFEGPKSERSALATHVRHGVLTAFTPPGDFDAAARVRDGVRTVYARYVGEGLEAA